MEALLEVQLALVWLVDKSKLTDELSNHLITLIVKFQISQTRGQLSVQYVDLLSRRKGRVIFA